MIASVTEVKARIFDIQRFSLKDGPGIRTTIFFMGCLLRCRWCHNPESLSPFTQLIYHSNLCTGCMKCIDVCKYGVHGKEMHNGTWIHTVDQSKCTGCGECIKVCCYDALALVGKEYSPTSLLEEVQKDFRYYRLYDRQDQSQGGITFSGGEPMLHVDFIYEFCSLIPDVHVAIETSGYAPTTEFERLLDYIDLYLFDFKFTNPKLHLEWCGSDNQLILENLDFLCRRGKKIILRLPLIPGVNDTAEHFDGIAALTKKYTDLMGVEILPYHTLGIGKLEQLGLPQDPSLPLKNASKEDIQRWLDELYRRGCAGVVVL